jgi:hypothetical protein
MDAYIRPGHLGTMFIQSRAIPVEDVAVQYDVCSVCDISHCCTSSLVLLFSSTKSVIRLSMASPSLYLIPSMYTLYVFPAAPEILQQLTDRSDCFRSGFSSGKQCIPNSPEYRWAVLRYLRLHTNLSRLSELTEGLMRISH